MSTFDEAWESGTPVETDPKPKQQKDSLDTLWDAAPSTPAPAGDDFDALWNKTTAQPSPVTAGPPGPFARQTEQMFAERAAQMPAPQPPESLLSRLRREYITEPAAHLQELEAQRPPDLTAKLGSIAQNREHNALVRGVAGLGSFATGAIQHPIRTADSLIDMPIEAVKTLAKYQMEQEEADQVAAAGGDPATVKRTVSPKDWAIASAQLAALGVAGPLEGATADVLGGAVARRAAAGLPTAGMGRGVAIASRAVAGAPVAAAYTPEDPLAGAIAGALGGGLHATLLGSRVPIPPKEGANLADHPERLLTNPETPRPATATARVEPQAPVPEEAPFTVETNTAGQALEDLHAQQGKPIGAALIDEIKNRRSADRAANTDALTGLGNQRAWEKARPAAEANPDIAIVRFDLNGFKGVNDVLGHAAGDEALKSVAQAIHQNAPGLPSFRVGGDEFAVAVPKADAERVRNAIEQTIGVNDLPGKEGSARFSISGGIGNTSAEADAAAIARKAGHKAEQGITPRAEAPKAPERPSFDEMQKELLAKRDATLSALGDGSKPVEFIPKGAEGRRSEIFSRDPATGGWRVTSWEKGVGPTGHIEYRTLDEAARSLMSARPVSGDESQVTAWAREQAAPPTQTPAPEAPTAPAPEANIPAPEAPKSTFARKLVADLDAIDERVRKLQAVNAKPSTKLLNERASINRQLKKFGIEPRPLPMAAPEPSPAAPAAPEPSPVAPEQSPLATSAPESASPEKASSRDFSGAYENLDSRQLANEFITNVGDLSRGAANNNPNFIAATKEKYAELKKRGLSDEQILRQFEAKQSQLGYSQEQALAAFNRFRKTIESLHGPKTPEQSPLATLRAAVAQKKAAPVVQPRQFTVPEAASGSEASVALSDGRQLATRYAIVDAPSISASHDPISFNVNPGYPEGVQGRAYHGPRGTAARQAVESATSKLDPVKLLDAGSSVSGPPVVTQDGYALIGNQRAMMLQRAPLVAPDKYSAYRDQLAQQAAKFGLNPDAVWTVPHPILVRVLTDPKINARDIATLADINRVSDIADVKAKDAGSEGASRASALLRAPETLDHLAQTIEPDDTIADYLGSPAGTQFVRSLIGSGVIGQQEVGRFIDARTGSVTPDGREVIKNMLYAAAVPDADVLDRAPKNIKTKIEHAIPAIVSANLTKGYEIGQLLSDALDILHSARANNAPLESYLAQGDLVGTAPNPQAVNMARFLDASPKAVVSSKFRQYASLAKEAVEAAASGDMFGYTPPTHEALLKQLATTSAAVGEGTPEYAGRSPERAIDHLKSKYPNVELDVFVSRLHPDTWQLAHIRVPKAERNTGIGTSVMRDLTALADDFGARLTLTPGLEGGRDRLKKFYRDFGFKKNRSDFAVSDTMIREPGSRVVREGEAPEYAPQRERFYSRLERAIEAAPFAKGTAEQWAAALSKNVAKGEREWTGIDDFLKENAGQVLTRRQVADVFEKGKIQLDESVGSNEVHQPLEDAKLAAERISSAADHAWHQAMRRLDIDRLDALNAQASLWHDYFPIDETLDTYHIPDTPEIRKLAQDVRESTKVTKAAYDAIKAVSRPKYEEYTLPGGENYREIKIQLQPRGKPGVPPTPLTKLPEGYDLIEDSSQPPGRRWAITPPGQISARPFGSRWPTRDAAITEALDLLNSQRHEAWADQEQQRLGEGSFTSGHFDEPNILAHVRTTDRTLANGEKVLFIEEIQSDWHQKGREHGYNSANRAELARLSKEIEQLHQRKPLPTTPELRAERERLIAEENKLLDRFNALRREQVVPDAPFKKTDEWVGLVMKRMIDEAVKGGYDRIAWTNGAQQADRYDLSKQVDAIRWRPESGEFLAMRDGSVIHRGKYDAKALPSVIGKEPADRLINTPTRGVSPGKSMGNVGRDDILAALKRAREENLRDAGIMPIAGLGRILNRMSNGQDFRQALAAEDPDRRPAVLNFLKVEEPDPYHEISGPDLKVGGYGMRAFYDEMLPGWVRDYSKKLGIKLTVEPITLPSRIIEDEDQFDVPDYGPLLIERTIERIEAKSDQTPIERRAIGYLHQLRLSGTGDFNADVSELRPRYRADVAEMLGGKVVSAKSVEQPSFIVSPALVREVEAKGQFLMEPGQGYGAPRTRGIPADAPLITSRVYNKAIYKGHADFTAAKAGDVEAAIRFVENQVRSESIAEAKQAFGSDVVYVAPVAQEATGTNAIPRTLARYYAEATDAAVNRDIVQTTRAFHTNADMMERLVAPAHFDGPVESGARYVLVDDVFMSGGTLAGLADYIQSQGGHVVGAVALANASRSGKLAAPKRLISILERRFGDAIRDELHIDPKALTADEAQYLIGFRSTDELRDRAATARRTRAGRQGAGSVQAPPSGEVSTEPRGHYDPSQIDAFQQLRANPESAKARALDKSDADTAFGSVAKRAKVAADLRPHLAQLNQKIKAAGLATGEERAAFVESHRAPAWANLTGLDVSTPKKMRAALSVMRHPLVEHMSVLFKDKNGVVADHFIYSSGALRVISFDLPALAREIIRRARELGVTTVTPAHNHPSGNPTFSPADEGWTNVLGALLQDEGILVDGHMTIDHDVAEWNTPDGSGGFTTQFVHIPGTDSHDWTTAVQRGLEVATSVRIAALVRDAVSPDATTVLYRDAQGRLIVAEPLSKHLDAEALLTHIDAQRDKLGVYDAIIALPGERAPDVWSAMNDARRANLSKGHYITDVIQVFPNGSGAPNVRSSVEYGFIPGPNYHDREYFDNANARLATRVAEPEPTLSAGRADEQGLFDRRARTALRPGRVQAPEQGELGPGTGVGEPDLFGNEDPLETQGASLSQKEKVDLEQSSFFGGREGGAAARSLRETEAQARADIARIRQELELLKGNDQYGNPLRPSDPRLARQEKRRRQLYAQLVPLEKLVNRDKAIGADELKARSATGDLFGGVSERTPQYGSITDTNAFRRWFGDSKVVDENGDPLVVYHGTANPDFDRFEHKGGFTGRLGFWFASDRAAAEHFAKPRYAGVEPGVHDVYLSIRRPKEYDGWRSLVDAINARRKGGVGNIEEGAASLRRSLVRAGYDGIVLRNSDTDSGVLRDDWVAFDSHQIKSASRNSGDFNQNTTSILSERSPRYNQAAENSMDRPIAPDRKALAAFRRWFGKSKVVDDEGRPLVVFHGTTADFDVFNPAKANIESDWGKGIYFTNTPEDVSANYAGVGPDLTNKIERRAEQIIAEKFLVEPEPRYGSPEYIRQRDEATAAAKAEFAEHEGAAVPVYLKFLKPFVLGGENETVLTWKQSYHRRTDEFDEPTGTLVDFMEALRNEASRYDNGEIDSLLEFLPTLGEDGHAAASDIIAMAAQDENFSYFTDPETGDMASHEIVRAALERMGFDGIIDNTVNQKFGSERRTGKSMTGMHEETVHYIAFRPDQIKSAIGNAGTFSPFDASIVSEPGAGYGTPKGDGPVGSAADFTTEHEHPAPRETGLEHQRPGLRVTELLPAIRKLIAPESLGPAAKGAAGTIRQATAEEFRAMAVARETLKQFGREVGKLRRKDAIAYWDAAERGISTGNKTFDAGNALLHKITQEVTDQLIAFDRLTADRTIENYIGRFWSKPKTNKARDFLRGVMGKRPFEGPKSFLKHRTLERFTDGLDAGLIPGTYNYVDAQLAKIAEMQRVLAAERILRAEKAHGRAAPVMNGQDPPVDANGDPWIRIGDGTDPAFNIYGPRSGMVKLPEEGAFKFTEGEGMGEGQAEALKPEDVEVIGPRVIGNWYAPADAAAVWKNFLSKGLRGNALVDAYLAPAQAASQLLLSFSGFHFTVIATEGIFSDLALATDNLANQGGKAKLAPSHIVKALGSPVRTAVLGRKLMQEYRAPGMHPELARVLDGMIQGGFRGTAKSEFWTGDRAEKFKRALKDAIDKEGDGKRFQGLVRLPFDAVWAGIELVSMPLMAKYVPWMKSGATYLATAQQLQKMPPGTSMDEIHRVMGDINKEMDYRFGQVVYDNHFLNSTVKHIAQMMFLAPGWTFGTIALAARGMRDIGAFPGRAYRRGKQKFGGAPSTGVPEELVGRSAAYWLGAVAGTMFINGLITYLLTGEEPDGKDFWAFRDGTKDPLGNWNRHTIPGYLMHDIYGWSHHPINTFRNKLSPVLTFMMRAAANRDFFGDMVYDTQAGIPTKAKQLGEAAVKQFGPLSYQNYKESKSRGEGTLGEKVRNTFGVTPAKREFVRTPAQNLIYEFLAQRGHDARTPDEADAANARRALRDSLRAGQVTREHVNDLTIAGELTRGQGQSMARQARRSSLERLFQMLTPAEAEQVWALANPEEKATWQQQYSRSSARFRRQQQLRQQIP